MQFRNIGQRDLMKIVPKLEMEEASARRRSPHPVYWYCLDGKRVLRVTLPNSHGGSGSISPGFLNGIRKSLLLTTEQFVDLVECPLTTEAYAEIVRSQNVV